MKYIISLTAIAFFLAFSSTASADMIDVREGELSGMTKREVTEILKDNFSFGYTSDGHFCYSEGCKIVYSKDASSIGDYENRKSLGSSAWYMRHEIEKKQSQRRLSTDKTWNRINAMLILRAVR